MSQTSTAAILLRHYGWNSEKLQEEFWNDPAQALQAAGLDPPMSPSASLSSLPPVSPLKSRNPFRSKSARAAPFECLICCEDFSADDFDTETFALGCDHRFCRNCWNEYLTGKIKSEGESARIQCMEGGCNRVVRTEAVKALVAPEVYNR